MNSPPILVGIGMFGVRDLDPWPWESTPVYISMNRGVGLMNMASTLGGSVCLEGNPWLLNNSKGKALVGPDCLTIQMVTPQKWAQRRADKHKLNSVFGSSHFDACVLKRNLRKWVFFTWSTSLQEKNDQGHKFGPWLT